MRNFPSRALVVIVPFAVACGGGGGDAQPDAPVITVIDAKAIDAFEPPGPDAQVFDFTCVGAGAPAVADPTITLSGAANGISLNGTTPSVAGLDQATVDTCKNNCVGVDKLNTTTTAMAPCSMNGCAFATGAVASGGVPIDGYLKVSKSTFRTSNVFPASPLSENVMGVPALAFSANAFFGATLFLGINQNPQNGDVGLFVTDCANTPINGATVSVKQNGNDVGQIIDASGISVLASGGFVVFDVPPGDTEVNATFNGMTFRAHTVTTFAGQTTATQIRPGF